MEDEYLIDALAGKLRQYRTVYYFEPWDGTYFIHKIDAINHSKQPEQKLSTREYLISEDDFWEGEGTVRNETYAEYVKRRT